MHIEETNNLFTNFFSSYDNELKSRMKRLDQLISRDHWLSVGNYKESILRQLIANVIPRKHEVSTGFILAADNLGNPIKSKQIDILIWNSYDYAPVFRDGDFVIVPPEACKAIIEVKGRLTRDELKKSLRSSDAIFEFARTPLSQNMKIKKYIFSFDSYRLHFPGGVFDGLSRYYCKQAIMPMPERMKCIQSRWPSDISWSLFSIDAIFILGKGAILQEPKNFGGTPHLTFEAYKTCNEDGDDHTYAFFEHEIHRSISTIHDSGLYYTKQPGLQSVAQNINISKCPGKSTMMLPELNPNIYWDNFLEDTIYRPKLA